MKSSNLKILSVLSALLFSSALTLSGAELISGKLRLPLRKNLTAPQYFYYGKTQLIRTFFYSWYARGNWYSDRSGVKNTVAPSNGVKIKKLDKTTLHATYNCTDFAVDAKYELLKDPDSVKVEFHLKARNDIYLGGIDAPGGLSLPLIRRNDKFTHFCEVSPVDASLKLKSKNDYPVRAVGVVRDNCIGGFSTADGKEGFFIVLDRRFYGKQADTPIIIGGVCFSKDVCRLIKKGEVIKGQFYIVPFYNNAAQTAKAALAKYCDPDPAKRWDLYAPYRELSQKTVKSFSTVADNQYLTAASGTTENVLPKSPLPARKVSAIKVAGAKNQQIFSQIVLKAKQNLKDLKFKADFPGFKEFRLERITPVPSDYPATSFAVAGNFPDILQKADTALLKAADGNAPYLLTLYIPTDAKAGIHKGKISIFSGNQQLAVLPVEVEVYNFALPKRSSFRTAFLAWTSRAYSSKFSARRHLLDQRKLRITTPMEIVTPCDKQGNIKNPDALRNAIKNALAAGDTCFRMSSVFSWRGMPHKNKTGKEAELYIKNFTRQLYTILKELKAEKYVWFLMMDETHHPEKNKMHRKWCEWVKESAPDMPIFSTQNHPEFSIADKADILCGPVSSVNVLRQRYGDKKEYWVYENGYPFSLGQDAVITRSMPLRNMQHNVAGYHQWSSCHWSAETDGKFRPGNFHGTASLYYPPEYGYRKNQPVRSMRLINMAQGIIDYDYAAMLRKMIAASPKHPRAAEAEKFLNSELGKLVPDVYTFNGNSGDFDRFRAGMARWIMILSKNF